MRKRFASAALYSHTNRTHTFPRNMYMIHAVLKFMYWVFFGNEQRSGRNYFLGESLTSTGFPNVWFFPIDWHFLWSRNINSNKKKWSQITHMKLTDSNVHDVLNADTNPDLISIDSDACFFHQIWYNYFPFLWSVEFLSHGVLADWTIKNWM